MVLISVENYRVKTKIIYSISLKVLIIKKMITNNKP